MSSLQPLNRRRVMGKEVLPPLQLRCIKFTMQTAGSVTLSIPAGVTASDYQYAEWSRDGRTWIRETNDGNAHNITTGNIPAGGIVYFRGKGTRMANSTTIYCHFVIPDDLRVACSGDIRSMLEPEQADWEHITTLPDYCFFKLFFYDRSLTALPDLPATSIGAYAYAEMFEGLDAQECTAMSVLPATTVGHHAYYQMFYAALITNAPAMSVTELPESACEEMFQSTSSLTTPPELLVTRAGKSAMKYMFRSSGITSVPDLRLVTITGSFVCQGMFENCQGLTKAPALPATTLYNGDYYMMFYGCRNLTQAPVLPAARLSAYAYGSMFQNCIKLAAVTMLATDISATSCLDNWLANVAASGVITKAAGTTLPAGASGVPSGWTTQDN